MRRGTSRRKGEMSVVLSRGTEARRGDECREVGLSSSETGCKWS